jgi:CBS domain-containing protein
MFDNILVRDWMTSPVITIFPNAAISTANYTMKEYGIRRLPVVENDTLVGIITIGDVREAKPSNATKLTTWELQYVWSGITVQDVMTRQVITISPEASIIDAVELMLEHKISGLPVINERHKLVGLLTESDIFRLLIKLSAKAVSVRVASVG